VLAVALVVLASCDPQPQADIMASRPVGSVKLTSRSLGELTISPSRCTAGDRERFLGADFADEESDVVLRLAVDPVEGPAVRILSRAKSSDKAVVFRRSECRAFQWSVDATHMRVNRIQDYRVSLDLDCTNAGGDSISGKVLASHCH
jgi:hypothetical protein